MQIPLFGKFKNTALSQFVKTSLTYNSFFSEILSEKEVDNDSNHWDKRQHHDPSHGLCRLAIIHQYRYHRENDNNKIHRYDYPMEIYHYLFYSSGNIIKSVKFQIT